MTQFFRFALPSRSLSYVKIVQAREVRSLMAQFLSFVLPSRSLSYVKIVQGERSTQPYDAVFELCTAEPQPILCKDSAR